MNLARVAATAAAVAILGPLAAAQIAFDVDPTYLARRDLERDGVPDRLGQSVRLELEVISAPGTFGGGTEMAFFGRGIGGGVEVVPDGPVPLPMLGDVVDVLGTVEQLDGRTRVRATDISVVVSGLLPGPARDVVIGEVLADPEAFEGTLVRIVGLSIAGGDPWPDNGDAAVVLVSDGQSTFSMFVDPATNIDGSPIPAAPFEVIGVISQSDTSAPFDSGYQLWPRQREDIVGPGVPLTFVEGPIAKAIGYCSARICWRTNRPSSSEVDFGLDGGPLNSSVGDPTPVLFHCLQLTGLDPDTTYDYTATSCIGPTCVTSPVRSFTTLDNLDGGGNSIPLEVDGAPRLLDLTRTRATLAWKSTSATETIVRYGLTPAVANELRISAPVIHHRATLTGLLPGAQYFIRIVSEHPPTDLCPVDDGDDCDGVIVTSGGGASLSEGSGSGSSDSGGAEWVELVNRHSEPIDLLGTTITDQDQHRYTFTAPLVLPPGAFAVLDSGNGTDDLDASDGLAVVYLGDEPQWTADVWDDFGDEIVLADATGAAIDYLRYGTPDDPQPEGFDWDETPMTELPAPLAVESLRRCDGGFDSDQAVDFQVDTLPTYGQANGPVPPSLGPSVRAERGMSGYLLSWTPVSGVTGYRIYRAPKADFANPVPIATVGTGVCQFGTCSFSDPPGLDPATGDMFFRVVAFDVCGGQGP